MNIKNMHVSCGKGASKVFSINNAETIATANN